ncbi:hypothetical protein PIROE2DRAFT_9044, partial [Piromyces sp. E2]
NSELNLIPVSRSKFDTTVSNINSISDSDNNSIDSISSDNVNSYVTNNSIELLKKS